MLNIIFQDLFVNLKPSKVKGFLEHLKPGLDGAQISVIDFVGVPSEIVRDCSDFCDGVEATVYFGGFITQKSDL